MLLSEAWQLTSKRLLFLYGRIGLLTLRDMSLNSDWTSFILKFSANQIEVTFNDVNSRKLFSIHDFLDTGIELSNQYGFLSLKFKSSSERANLISHMKMAYSTKKDGKFNLRNTRWSREDYPCRVFVSNDEKILSFYNKDPKNTLNNTLTDRITVFRNVVHALVDFKIAEALSK